MVLAEDVCPIQFENHFGPAVTSACLNGFDFTLFFEETVLTAIPLGIVFLALPYRFLALKSTTTKIYAAWVLPLKLALYLIYIAIHIVLLVLWARPGAPRTDATLATTILTIFIYPLLAAISSLEHLRSFRPSTVLNLFLGLTTVLDIARARTLFFVSSAYTEASLFLAAYLVKVLLFCVEVSEKRCLLNNQQREVSNEALAGILNRSLFLWVNNLFLEGFRKILSIRGLPSIDEDLIACSTPTQLRMRWEGCNKQGRYALLWIFVVHYRWTIMAGVPPRLLWVGMSFAQPFLVERVLNFIQERPAQNASSIAYGLIGAYAVVYTLLAVAYAFFQHKIDRLIIKSRGSLVALIFEKTLRLGGTGTSDTSALTLFSQDVDRIGFGLRDLHNVWSAFIEIALAMWLLERLIGVSVLAPALLICIVLLIGIPLANLAANAQGEWLEAIEVRLAVTAKALESMKTVKMTGVVHTVSRIITKLRQDEIRVSGKYRFYTTIILTVSYVYDVFAPVLGFGTFIILAERRHTQTLTQSIAFAALTLFSLLIQPVVTLVDGLEDLKIVAKCFERIQDYLIRPERQDYRIIRLQGRSDESPCTSDGSPNSDQLHTEGATAVELKHSSPEQTGVAHVLDVTAGWKEGDKSTIGPLTADFGQLQITMIVGPVGCGKSTLLRLLLGEVPVVEGLVATSFRHAALCTQSAWLRFGTVQQNILGDSQWDQLWYHEVTAACDLQSDFALFPNGDQTKIGIKGSQLSGGQQMRVSLARALYSRAPVLILDDVLTGQDRRTEQKILDSVFSLKGLAKTKGLTVVMATSSVHHLRCADQVIVLGSDGLIECQGTFDNISSSSDFLSKLKQESNRVAILQEPEIDFQSALEEADINDEVFDDEARRTGDAKVYLYYFKNAGWWRAALSLGAVSAFIFGLSFPSVWLQWWANSNTEYGTNHVGYWVGTYAGLSVIAIIATFASSYVILMMIVPVTARRFHRYLLETTGNATAGFLTGTAAGSILNRFSQDLELVDMELPSAFETVIISVLDSIAEGILVFVGSGYVAAAIPGVLIVVYLIQNFYLRTSRQLRLLDIEAKAPIYSHFLEVLGGLSTVRAYGWTEVYTDHNTVLLNDSQKPYYLLFTVQRWLTLVLNLLVAGLAILLVALVTTIHGSSTSLLGVALFNVVSFGSTLEGLITDWTELEQSIGAISRIRSYVSSTPLESDHDSLQSKSNNQSGGGSSSSSSRNSNSNANTAREGSIDHGGVDRVFDRKNSIHATMAPPLWPSAGHIEFKGVTASYIGTDPILRDIDLDLVPGERIAVVGRTGSGKSSLLSVILRTLDYQTGSIHIDGTDIRRIPRARLRERVNTMPQSPFFLHGSIRLNLDPQGLLHGDDLNNDEENIQMIWALKEVGLYDHLLASHATRISTTTSTGTHAKIDATTNTHTSTSFGSTNDIAPASAITSNFDQTGAISNPNHDPRSGADLDLSQMLDPSCLSHGQGQLFAIARVLLKPSRLVLLDEPMTSLDVATASRLNGVLREHFRGSTMVQVTHQLGDIIPQQRDEVQEPGSFDKVIVMDAGRVVEVGTPADLLRREDGWLRALVGEAEEVQ